LGGALFFTPRDVGWSWFFYTTTGKIPFLIRKDIMASDEAIVAVIGHEMFELAMLRSIFADGAPVEGFLAASRMDTMV
jgi:hypothetical protein